MATFFALWMHVGLHGCIFCTTYAMLGRLDKAFSYLQQVRGPSVLCRAYSCTLCAYQCRKIHDIHLGCLQTVYINREASSFIQGMAKANLLVVSHEIIRIYIDKFTRNFLCDCNFR